MNFLRRLFRSAPDERDEVRPLYQAIVAVARRAHWYRDLGVADSVAGRFDMVSAITALTILRLEVEPACRSAIARLTELFIDDMDAQLRQSGVGDLVVGKHMGRLVSVLGGRLGAFRAALALADDAALAEVVRRNLTLADESRAGALAAEIRRYAAALASAGTAEVLAGDLP